MVLCIKHADLLRFENMYLMTIIKKALQRHPQIFRNLVFVIHFADSHSDTNIGFRKI